MPSSLTVRPFRNIDVNHLETLWVSSQYRSLRKNLIPLSKETLDAQVLGLGFENPRSIMLAFDGDTPVGYVHTALAPSEQPPWRNTKSGQICFLCVEPSYHDLAGATRALIRAAEIYLIDQGVTEIYGGSPRPCAPYYIGFLGGAEAIAFFDRDQHIIRGFMESGYHVHKKTTRFHLRLIDFSYEYTDRTSHWRSELILTHNAAIEPKNWWEACAYANGEWFEIVASPKSNSQLRVGRVRIRTVYPGMAKSNGESQNKCCVWDAALMNIRVHSRYHHQGVGAFILGEALRHLVNRKQACQIEAHISEDDPYVASLLRTFGWQPLETGTIFHKDIRR